MNIRIKHRSGKGANFQLIGLTAAYWAGIQLLVAFIGISFLPTISLGTSWKYVLGLNTTGPRLQPVSDACQGQNYDDIVRPNLSTSNSNVIDQSTDLSITWNTYSRDADQFAIPEGGYEYYVLYKMTNGAQPASSVQGGAWHGTQHHVTGCHDHVLGGVDDISTFTNLAAQDGLLGPPYVLWVAGLVDGGYWNNPNNPSIPNPVSIPIYLNVDPNPPAVSFYPSSGTFATAAPPASIQTTVSKVDNSPFSYSYNWTFSGGPCPASGGPIYSSQAIPFPSGCGAGTYTLNVHAFDASISGNPTDASASYTLVDITPQNFSGVVQNDRNIQYTWSLATTPIDHYQMVMNDPSGNNTAAALTLPAPNNPIAPSTTSVKVDYMNTPLPWGMASGPNLLSSATLRACFDTACTVSAVSNSTASYTLADPVGNSTIPDPTRLDTKVTVQWDPGQNHVANPSASPNGTNYRINYTDLSKNSSNNTILTIPTSLGLATSPLSSLTPNTSYNYTIDAINGDNITATQQVPAFSFWTHPSAPTSAPFNISATKNSITASFLFASANPPATKYVLQASLASDFSSAPIISSAAIATGSTSDSRILSGLNPGTAYFLRACAISMNPMFASPSPEDGCGPATTNPVTTFIPAGVITARTPQPLPPSLTANWTVIPAPNVTIMQAFGTDATGTKGAPVSISPTINPTIQVILPFSNTSYTLILQHLDTTSGSGTPQAQNYPGSDVTGVTPADFPGAPIFAPFGSATTNMNLSIALGSDTNSPDSLYAIEITPPNGPVGYLSGTAGGTAASALSSTLVWRSSTTWSSTNANQLLNVALSSVYKARVFVLENYTGNPVPSAYTSQLTPGTVSLASYSFGSGVSLDNIVFGVPVAANLTAVFNVPIDPASLNITATQSVGAGAPQPYTFNLPSVTGSTLTLSPANGSWSNNTVYTITLNAGVSDFFGFTTKSTSTIKFVTVPPLDPNNTSSSTTVISPLDTLGSAFLSVPENTIPIGGFIAPRVQFLSPASPVSGAPASALNVKSQGVIETFVKAEVDVYPNACNPANPAACVPGNPNPTSAGNQITLRLVTPASTAGNLNHFDPATIGIYQYNSQGRLVLVNGSHYNSADGSATAPIMQSGLFFLAGAATTQLSGAIAFPVPYRPSLGHTVITFKNLASASTIKVYTIMGELVWQTETDAVGSDLTWNVTNRDGDKVASGVYIYQIKNSFSEKRGKLIIIR